MLDQYRVVLGDQFVDACGSRCHAVLVVPAFPGHSDFFGYSDFHVASFTMAFWVLPAIEIIAPGSGRQRVSWPPVQIVLASN